MYRRMLFVGLGGSGGKTLRVLKRDLKEWLNDLGWEGSFPIGWQFLHIDTPSIPDGIRKGGGSLDDSEYLGLIGEGVGFDAVAGKIDKIASIESELLGWRVDGQALKVPLTMGAGQFRAIGRSIAICYSQPIKERLGISINRLNNPQASAELATLYSMAIGTPPSVAPAPPIVIVVSSLAGGTGAGLLVDVCDILRALNPTWGGDSIALLYTPEVFLGLGDGAVAGVQPNSLAAISEILNGYWWHGGTQNSQVQRKSLAALKAAGLANDIPNSGPFCSYLVGSTSAGGVQYQTDIELFETVGAALVSWATDIKVQQNFIAHTIGNWQAAAKANQPSEDVLVNHGAGVEPGVPAFSALGFSRVSLGTKYLERYAARRLAKDAALHLANAHLASAEAQAMIQSRKIIDPEQIVDEIAERYVSWFLERSVLEERGPDKNQIVDMLTPEDSTSEWTKAVNRALELAALPGSHPASAWIETIDSGVEQATLAYHDAMTKLVHSRVKEWLKVRPNEVLRVAEDVIARFGLKVAAAIIMKASNVLSNPATGVVVELRAERDNFQGFAQSTRWQEQVRLKLDASSKSKLAFDHPSVREAVTEALRYSICVTNAHICDRAAALIGDFATGFLRPLSRAIEDASALLDLSIDDTNDWPNWGPGKPPANLCPPKSEWTLIEPDEFAEVFDRKLAETFAGETTSTEVGDHQTLARTDVVSGEFIRKLAETSPDSYRQLLHLQLLSPAQKWSADYSVSQDAEPRKDLVVEVKVLPEQLNARAIAWLRRSGTPFQLLLSTDLRSYTAQEPHQVPTATLSEYKTRQLRLLEKLTAAISAASPLVGLDQTLIGQLHPRLTAGGSLKIKRDASEVPFGGAHALEKPVSDLLAKTCYETRQGELEKIMVGSAKVPHIDIVSQLDSPVSPLVVKSLMQPISNAWTAVKANPRDVPNFWSHRRARTLREFVPVPQEHLGAMIRGWFTGKLLQIIKDEPGEPVSIVRDVDDRSPLWVTFPYPTLTEASDRREQLPAILESLTLAYAAVGTVSSLEPLAPYIALRDYGSSNPSAAAELYSYRSLNPTLRRWLQSGQVGNSAAIPNYSGPRANLSGATEADRRKKVEEFLNEQIRSYTAKHDAHLHEARRDPSVLGRAPFWPAIKSDIVVALDQLKIAVGQVTDDSDF
jgi:hypothetical protein